MVADFCYVSEVTMIWEIRFLLYCVSGVEIEWEIAVRCFFKCIRSLDDMENGD